MLATASRDQITTNNGTMGLLPPTWQPMPYLSNDRQFSSHRGPYSREEEHTPFVMRTGYCGPNYFSEWRLGYALPYVPNPELAQLLSVESRFYADVSPLLTIKSDVENMVDASMRDESLRRLLSLHRVFYDLSPLAFCKAVSLVDTFITHVKVKPKYMMCVAVACYYIVSKFEPREHTRPTVESLVRLTRCGGTPEDLCRMVDIILSKLGSPLIAAVGANSATPLDFLRIFLMTNGKDPNYSDLPRACIRQLEVALCNTATSFYRPCSLALSLLAAYQQNPPHVSADELETQAYKTLQLLNVNDLFTTTNVCRASWIDVETCMKTLLENGTLESYSVSPVKTPVDSSNVTWTISRRTKSKLSAQTPPSLHSIQEFIEEEEEAEMEEDEEE